MSDPIGVILYEGPSRIDGKPIVVIATFKTKNDKTGNMVQTWILRKNVHPMRALKTGSDVSVCGGCPLRRKGCYVKVWRAPASVWRAYRRGSYPKYDKAKHAHLFLGRKLRLGAYGDPVAAPLTMWRPIMRLASGRTGYTHQWRLRRFRRWNQYIMASTHDVYENQDAQDLGFRTFRSTPVLEVAENEIVCPASPEGGSRRDCATCLACDGGSIGKKSIVILAHGSKATVSMFQSAMEV